MNTNKKKKKIQKRSIPLWGCKKTDDEGQTSETIVVSNIYMYISIKKYRYLKNNRERLFKLDVSGEILPLSIVIFFKFIKKLLLIKGEFLLKRLVSINFSRLFYKDLYFFNIYI